MPLFGEAKREYQLRWIKQRRDAWVQANGPCASCGSWEQLEVDHKNPDDKALETARLWSLAIDNPVRMAELAKCQILCHGCHLGKTHDQIAFACAKCVADHRRCTHSTPGGEVRYLA